MEELCIENIEKGIRLIRSGKKSPKDAGLGVYFKRLRDLNDGIYNDLIAEYKLVIESYNIRKDDGNVE
jgi:hypothetical protein